MLPGFPSRKNRTIRTSCPARGAAAATPRTNPTSVRAERRMATIVSTPGVRGGAPVRRSGSGRRSEVEGGHLRRLEGDPLGGRGELPAGEERPQDSSSGPSGNVCDCDARRTRGTLRSIVSRSPDERAASRKRAIPARTVGASRSSGATGKFSTSRDENVVRPRASVRERRAPPAPGIRRNSSTAFPSRPILPRRRPVPGVARVRRPVDTPSKTIRVPSAYSTRSIDRTGQRSIAIPRLPGSRRMER